MKAPLDQFLRIVEKLPPIQVALLVVALFFFGPVLAAFVLVFRWQVIPFYRQNYDE